MCHPISAPKYRTKSISRIVSVTAWLASALLMVGVVGVVDVVDVVVVAVNIVDVVVVAVNIVDVVVVVVDVDFCYSFYLDVKGQLYKQVFQRLQL